MRNQLMYNIEILQTLTLISNLNNINCKVEPVLTFLFFMVSIFQMLCQLFLIDKWAMSHVPTTTRATHKTVYVRLKAGYSSSADADKITGWDGLDPRFHDFVLGTIDSLDFQKQFGGRWQYDYLW